MAAAHPPDAHTALVNQLVDAGTLTGLEAANLLQYMAPKVYVSHVHTILAASDPSAVLVAKEMLKNLVELAAERRADREGKLAAQERANRAEEDKLAAQERARAEEERARAEEERANRAEEAQDVSCMLQGLQFVSLQREGDVYIADPFASVVSTSPSSPSSPLATRKAEDKNLEKARKVILATSRASGQEPTRTEGEYFASCHMPNATLNRICSNVAEADKVARLAWAVFGTNLGKPLSDNADEYGKGEERTSPDTVHGRTADLYAALLWAIEKLGLETRWQIHYEARSTKRRDIPDFLLHLACERLNQMLSTVISHEVRASTFGRTGAATSSAGPVDDVAGGVADGVAVGGKRCAVNMIKSETAAKTVSGTIRSKLDDGLSVIITTARERLHRAADVESSRVAAIVARIKDEPGSGSTMLSSLITEYVDVRHVGADMTLQLCRATLQASRYAANRVRAAVSAGCGEPFSHAFALASTDRCIRLINVVAERRTSALPDTYTSARPQVDSSGTLLLAGNGCAVVQQSSWLPLTAEPESRPYPSGWLLLAAVLLTDPLTSCAVHLHRLIPAPASASSRGLQFPAGLSLYPCIASGGYSLIFDACWQETDDVATQRPVVVKIARSRYSVEVKWERKALTALHDEVATMHLASAATAACALRACMMHEFVAADEAAYGAVSAADAPIPHNLDTAQQEELRGFHSALANAEVEVEALVGDVGSLDDVVRALCAWPMDVAALQACPPHRLLAAAVLAGKSRLPSSIGESDDYLVVDPKGMVLDDKLAMLTSEADKINTLQRAMRDVLLALIRAHALQYVHRDVRPPNMIWVDDAQGGRAMLIDWGVCHSPTSSVEHKSVATVDLLGLIRSYHCLRSCVAERGVSLANVSGALRDGTDMIQAMNRFWDKQINSSKPVDSFCAKLMHVLRLAAPRQS
ncbi:hypothetical protein EON66_01980, partial [archaeon]